MGLPGPHNLSCVSYKDPSVRGGLGGAGGAPQAGTVRCPPGQCCIGIWNQSRALVQGCWGGGGAACPAATCTPSPAGPPGGTVLVCLCRGHLCNGNGTGTPMGPGGPQHGPAPGRVGPAGTLWLWGAGPPLVLLILTCAAVLGLRRARTHSGRLPRGGGRLRAPPAPPSPELPALRFLQVLQTGRFSAVWRGTLHQRPVAIKAFAAGGAGRFAAERAVLALPLMEHDNVTRLLGTRAAGPRAQGGLLVLQLCPGGSLRHFLGQHVGTWATSVRLALSLARGLAFLHQELWRDGLYKPSVVHRDLSSQNVLVREDGTCAIGDFGLALALPPRAQSGTGAQHAVPIRKAGTQRYLAPEILDESLDLRWWGRALRQADVYALALLLWEILSRCQALSPGAPVPAFRLAYEAELGPSPTGAELRRLAVDEGRRPLIPPAWHRGPPPGGALPELLEDCWDPDPEARLSAERALQRLQRLAAGPPPAPPGAPSTDTPPGDPGVRAAAPPAAEREVGAGETEARGEAGGTQESRGTQASRNRCPPPPATDTLSRPGEDPGVRPLPRFLRAGPRSERRRQVPDLSPAMWDPSAGQPPPPNPVYPPNPTYPPQPPPPNPVYPPQPMYPQPGVPPNTMGGPGQPPYPPGAPLGPAPGCPPPLQPPHPGVPPPYPPVLDKKAAKKLKKKMKKVHKKHKGSSSSSSSSSSDSD